MTFGICMRLRSSIAIVTWPVSGYGMPCDWEPPQAQWLSPKEVGHLLAQKIPLAVCFNPHTHSFGTVTKADAEMHNLSVHHYM